MAVTSPDNIWTPDSGDEYALTVDLAAMADTVQDAILNRTSMVVADLDELVTATPTFPGKTAVVLSLGAMFRRNSADTEWVQFTPAQVGPSVRDAEYAKAGGAYKVATASNYNGATGAMERYYPGSAGTGWHSEHAGLIPLIPTSVTPASGAASISASGKVTFSGAASVLVNGCFTDAYAAYRILIHVTNLTTTRNLLMRLASGGAADASGSYSYGGSSFNGSALVALGANAQTFWYITGGVTGNISLLELTLQNPKIAGTTQGLVQSVMVGSAAGGATLGLHHSGDAASFDGFLLAPDSGSNLSGTLQVFGYNPR